MDRELGPCPNCGKPFAGRYCHHCGYTHKTKKSIVAAVLIVFFLVAPCGFFSACFLYFGTTKEFADPSLTAIGLIGLSIVSLLIYWIWRLLKR